jgi:hypothetical protein
MTEQELLEDCLRRLNQARIEYMLVGSMASNYWGIPRSTHDIDFVVQYSDADVPSIVKLFEGDFFIQEISVRSALKPPYQFNALDNRSALKVDFFRLAGDAYELERFNRRRQVTILGQPAFLAAPEDIVLHKFRWYKISPSDRQLTDAAGILSVSGDIIDDEYLDHWAGEIGVTDLLQQVRSGRTAGGKPAHDA